MREQRIDFAYESAMLPVALAALATCAPVAPAPEPVTGSPESVQPGFDPAALQADPEATARLRFGKALVSRALAAPVHLFAKHYMGLAPPPIVQPDGSYRYPDPPMAMLIREDGQWLAATLDGMRPAKPDKVAAIDAIVGDAAFWADPAWARPGCTDAGGSLLMLRAPPRQGIVRQGACGATQRTERLGFLALEA